MKSHSVQRGVVITTIAQRDNNVRKKLTARTLPCKVTRLTNVAVQMTLVEGRNRQIRKMMGALQLSVTKLQRQSFLGITMDNLRGPGDWRPLTAEEMKIVERALEQASADEDEVDEASEW